MAAADLATRIDYFESSEETTQTARLNSERYRKYYDGIQLTSQEVNALKKRGQPPVVINKIKSKVNYLKGMERNNLSDPKAVPRNMPSDEQSASVSEQALRYAVQNGFYAKARKRAWDNIVVEGAGGVKLQPKQGRARVDIEYQRVRWDRMFWDPHSEEDDFSDARYLGEIVWLDFDEAIRVYGKGANDVLESTLASSSLTDTFDDKPKWKSWGDRKRRRVRVCQMYCRGEDGWMFYEFTKAGDLKEPSSSWLKDEDGAPIHPYVWRSAYTEGGTNARYSPIRDLIDPQDEYNKRRSKALHLLNTRGMLFRRGAIKDAEAARRELAKPDYALEVEGPPTEPLNASLMISENLDMGAAQAKMMEVTAGELDVLGPNASMQGKDPRDQSGRAILAQQQGGMIEAGDLTDQLDSMDEEVYRKTWLAIVQLWPEPMWIQVTDNPEAPQWIGLNQPITNEFGFQVGMQNGLAEMDMDFTIVPAPKTIMPEGEEFQAFAQLSPTLMEMVLNGQFDMAKLTVEMIPNIRPLKKRRLFAYIDGAQKAQAEAQQAAMQAAQQQMQMEAQAEAQKAQAVAQVNAQAKVAEARMSGPIEIEKERIKAQAKAAADPKTPLDRAEQIAGIQKTGAEIDKLRADTYKAKKDADRPQPARASA